MEKARGQGRHQPASLETWSSKYRLRDAGRRPLESSVEETLERVALALAAEEAEPGRWQEPFREALLAGCLPAGRIVANAGAGELHRKASLIN